MSKAKRAVGVEMNVHTARVTKKKDQQVKRVVLIAKIVHEGRQEPQEISTISGIGEAAEKGGMVRQGCWIRFARQSVRTLSTMNDGALARSSVQARVSSSVVSTPGADALRVYRARTPGTLRRGLDRERISLTTAESDPPAVCLTPKAISTHEMRVRVADAYLSGHWANSRLTGTAISAAEMRMGVADADCLAQIIDWLTEHTDSMAPWRSSRDIASEI
ncbi:hypothetical protein B0H16DRAFT_1782774 [Mycena metata]|uniref:Uncharacterized protein n=1 Tax=Mycena metata TaxID=1033252 RepID=A0AAD7HNI7_9AGAR|nr:hypothetical protein B0H16DRAFT_1782774 [Mycena metata]